MPVRWVYRVYAVLRAGDVKPAVNEIDLVPAQRTQF
jgi:hypothetical protein